MRRMGAAVTETPFDLTDPPDDPPATVRQPVLWRVAICLFRDHVPGLAGVGVLARCRACGQVWPCRCRRFAERALVDACSSEEPARTPEDGAASGHNDLAVPGTLDADPR